MPSASRRAAVATVGGRRGLGALDASGGRRRRRSAQEGLGAGPVADDVDGVLLGRVARRRGAGPGSPASGTSRPTSARSRRAAWSRPRASPASPSRAADERGDAAARSALGLARVRVVLADVRGHGPLQGRRGRRRPVAASCERSLPPAGGVSHMAHADRPGRMVPAALPDGRQPGAARVGGRRDASRPGGRSAVDELDRVLVAERRCRTARVSVTGWPERLERRRRSPGRWRGSRRTSTGGGEVLAPARRTSAARRPPVATSTPPSTSAETNWAWICGWASPPIEPATTHGPGCRPGTASRAAACAASACPARARSGGPGRG